MSVISQSGSMLGTLITRGQARGLGFSKLVSVGNECDLGVGEIADLLVDDPETGAILLFLETFRDAASSGAGGAPRLCRGQTGDRLQAGSFGPADGPRRRIPARWSAPTTRRKRFSARTASCASICWKRCSSCPAGAADIVRPKGDA